MNGNLVNVLLGGVGSKSMAGGAAKEIVGEASFVTNEDVSASFF